jgi:hypothetical protein
MAALYAQGLAWGDMYKTVRKYAARMSSVHHLLLVGLRSLTSIWLRHAACVTEALMCTLLALICRHNHIS